MSPIAFNFPKFMFTFEYMTAAQIKEKWYSSDEEGEGCDVRSSEATCSTPVPIIQSLAGQVSSGSAVDTNEPRENPLAREKPGTLLF